MILNMITTGAMVRTGKAYQNLMVDVVQSNEKLRTRAENIVMAATDVSCEQARRTIDEANGKVKLAITMILTGKDAASAQALLDQSGGSVHNALGNR